MDIVMQQQIIEELQSLHYFQLKTVLQFVRFLQNSKPQTRQDSLNDDLINNLSGKYRNCLSGSEDFARRKWDR
jgi:hypothetical protein